MIVPATPALRRIALAHMGFDPWDMDDHPGPWFATTADGAQVVHVVPLSVPAGITIGRERLAELVGAGDNLLTRIGRQWVIGGFGGTACVIFHDSEEGDGPLSRRVHGVYGVTGAAEFVSLALHALDPEVTA